MDQPTFDVVFDGDLVAGRGLHEVELLLARSLRVSVEQVHAMVAQGSATLQTNVGQVAAERWVEAFRQAGALCKLVPHSMSLPEGGAHARGAPVAPIAPIVPTRATPRFQLEARADVVGAGRRSAAAGPVAPIVPSRAVPETASATHQAETRLQPERLVPPDPPPAAASPAPGSPRPSPIAPAPVIAAAESCASPPAVGDAAESSHEPMPPPVEIGAATFASPDIPDLQPPPSMLPSTDATVPTFAAMPEPSRGGSVPAARPPHPDSELPLLTSVGVESERIPLVETDAAVASPDALASPASIPLGGLLLADVRPEREPGVMAPPSANALVERLVGSSDLDPKLRAGEEPGSHLPASSHLLELDQGDPAAAPIELETDAQVAFPVRNSRRPAGPASGGAPALPTSRPRPAAAYPPGDLAADRRTLQDSGSPRSSRAGLMMGALIAVIVGVGALMAGGGALLSRWSDPATAPEDQPNEGVTRVGKWEVQFTTATRFIVSYQCDDEVDRNIVCWSPIRDQYECTCYRDGYEGQRFELQGVPTTTTEAHTLAQQRCQWKLAE